jgi:hypothetical protein
MDDRAVGYGVEAGVMAADQARDEVRSRRRRAWYRRRDVLFIAAVTAIWLAWQSYGRITAPGRMSDAVVAALAQNTLTLDILVIAKFPPERFHSNIYNEIGAQRGTAGATTILASVRRADVKWLARQYWIERLDLAPSHR